MATDAVERVHEKSSSEALRVLEEGKRAVEAAESELEAALAEMSVMPRAEKTAISRSLELALERLRVARSRVVIAERILTAADEPEADDE